MLTQLKHNPEYLQVSEKSGNQILEWSQNFKNTEFLKYTRIFKERETTLM